MTAEQDLGVHSEEVSTAVYELLSKAEPTELLTDGMKVRIDVTRSEVRLARSVIKVREANIPNLNKSERSKHIQFKTSEIIKGRYGKVTGYGRRTEINA